MLEFLVNLAGWLGAVLLLLAYLLVSTKRLAAAGAAYQLLNLAGGLLLALNSLYFGAMPSVFVNAVWILIGLGTLLSLRASRGDLRG